MQRKVDIAIIGAGVLGTSVAYWIATRYAAKVCVIEAETGIAHHASSKNTGVVHSPFYLDPDLHKEMAHAMIASRPMWKRLAEKVDIPWSQVGVLEVATTDSERGTLDRHMKWGIENGIIDGQLELVDSSEIAKTEPNLRCTAAIRHKVEAATDFGRLTYALATESKKAGVEFVFGFNVTRIQRTNSGHILYGSDDSQIDAELVINCGGGRALEIAKMMGQAKEYTALYFRGEYWRADPRYTKLVGTSVYSVPRYPNYPFLDPHWIVRADGHAEVGPNAVPVASANAYEGVGGLAESVSKAYEIMSTKTRNLLFDTTFLRMVGTEWKSSISKSAMISRVSAFVPSVRPEMFTKKGEAGIRTPIVTPQGELGVRTIELYDDNVCSVINYNSPGATGAPAYSAGLVKRLADNGYIKSDSKIYKDGIWTESDYIQ